MGGLRKAIPVPAAVRDRQAFWRARFTVVRAFAMPRNIEARRPVAVKEKQQREQGSAGQQDFQHEIRPHFAPNRRIDPKP